MKRLFWDIETSPGVYYSWRSGSKIFIDPDHRIRESQIICISYKWEGTKRVNSLKWNDGSDTELIRAFAPILEASDEAVAHNGDNFDIKWYRWRHMVHGLPPIPETKTVDTYKIAKRLFYADSLRLDQLAKRLLGERKIHTNFGLWRGCLDIETPDPEERARNVRKMVRYCNRDVLLVERIWDCMRPYSKPSTHAAVDKTGNPKDRWRCQHCASDDVSTNKRRTTAAGMVRWTMHCEGCGRYYTIADAVHNWYLEAKDATS